MATQAPGNRWTQVIAGTVLMICLGTVYAWSFFQKPLVETYQWSNSEVAWAFSLAIAALGIAAAIGGVQLPKVGPTKLAMLGGFLFGSGYLLGALALQIKSLPLLWIGYGIIGGAGLGLGYVTPVATVAKWFPDKKGFATGFVVMGFGLGALLMSKVFAPQLMASFQGNLINVFGSLGIVFLVLTLPMGALLKNPPAGYVPEGWTPPPAAAKPAGGKAEEHVTAKDCITSGRFIVMWLFFFANITAGIAIIGFQSPLLQDLLKKLDPSLTAVSLAASGATLIAVSSLFNGLGRFLWGWVSDKIGRAQAFNLILGSQILVFVALMKIESPILFSILFCYVLLCYGGGFGTMPSFVTDVFGARLMPVVYGTILTAWSAAGIVGPQLVAVIKDTYPAATHPGVASYYSFMMGAIFLTFGFLLSLTAKNHPEEHQA